MSCGCEKCGGSAADKILGVLICTKTNSCFVQCIVGRALPILFWLSVIGSFALACKVANNGFSGFSFSTFLVVLLSALITVLLTFYFIYLVRDIRDANKCCCCGDECCEDEACEVETKNAKNPAKAAPVKKAAVSKDGAKPAVKRNRKKVE